MNAVTPYLKAILAAAIAALSVLATSPHDYIPAAIAGLVALGGVYAVPNIPKKG